MGVEEDELEGQGADSTDREEEQRSRIAAPGIASEMPAVSLRGLPAPTPGSTEDLENRAASGIASRQVAPPSPLETRTTADRAELGRLQTTGSGISQIHNPIARYALRGLETIGGILSPRATSMVPGTELHHDVLLGQARGRIGEDLGEAQQQATTGHTEAETEQAEAAAAKDRRQTAEMGQPKPKEEDWEGVMSNGVPVTNENGQPLEREKNSGSYRWADLSGVKVAPKTQTFQEQNYDEWKKTHPNGTRMQFEKELKENEQQTQKPQRLLGITPDHKVIEITPGMTLPEGTQTVTGEIKAEAGEQGKNAATGYANDYLNRKMYTGPGDEALMEKFFEMAKPSSGFRMTEAQMSMLRNAQGWLNSLGARAHHAIYGTWFSDDQRKQIVDTMNELGQTGARPGHGATQKFTDNGVVYNIPADQVSDFKHDHPNAK